MIFLAFGGVLALTTAEVCGPFLYMIVLVG